jgi:hypothetical protein
MVAPVFCDFSVEATGQQSRTTCKYFPRGRTVRSSVGSMLNSIGKDWICPSCLHPRGGRRTTSVRWLPVTSKASSPLTRTTRLYAKPAGVCTCLRVRRWCATSTRCRSPMAGIPLRYCTITDDTPHAHWSGTPRSGATQQLSCGPAPQNKGTMTALAWRHVATWLNTFNYRLRAFDFGLHEDLADYHTGWIPTLTSASQ